MNDLNDLLALKDTLNTHITTLNTQKESVVINNFESKNYGEKFLNTGCNYIRTDASNVRYDFNKWLDHLNNLKLKEIIKKVHIIMMNCGEQLFQKMDMNIKQFQVLKLLKIQKNY